MSGIIPKEELASFQRWQANSFDSPTTTAATKPLPAHEVAVETSHVEPLNINLPTAEDIERIHEEARALGYQTGYEEGRQAAEQAGREAANDEAERFAALSNNLHRALDELDQTVADQLLALATEIAAQVISGSIVVKNELLLPIIREAIAALPIHHTHLTLRLNPADAAAVRAQLGEQLSQTGAQIIEDKEISRGGCLVRAGSSEVDATLETRWKRVLESIGAQPREWLEP
ncbi:MAG: flagellar assembly protein FliH [Rhodocyclales bacterium GT-UBC]|nr:MAG: flagellar assembly protein FliH [Rhodocyclales bacterium GT-UBC]